VVLVAHLVAIPFTGTSINPARSFGPALASENWDAHWVFWLGPLAGGVLAGVSYQMLYGSTGWFRKSAAAVR
jgi:glycerol uptake facilitator-like aquaporin